MSGLTDRGRLAPYKPHLVLTFVFLAGAHEQLIEDMEGPLVRLLPDDPRLLQQVGLWDKREQG